MTNDNELGLDEELDEEGDGASEEEAPKPKAKKAAGKKAKKEESDEEEESDDESEEEAPTDHMTATSFGDLAIMKIPGMKSGKSVGMLKAMSESPLVPVVLPYDALNPSLAVQDFQMNGVRFQLPVGEQLMVPQNVSDFIRQTIYARKR